jgi:hypothetical protein
MATRSTTHILKNSDIVNRPLPSSLLKGEPIVNTADGIVFFSGVTTSTSEWTPAGTGTTSNFFEVGSNLYDLRVRNKITHYNNLTNLSGKFLSGTTNGFELANISDITGVDTFVTGNTLTPATNFTNTQQALLEYNITPIGGPYVIDTLDTFTTGGTYNSGTTSIDFDRNNGTTFSVDLSNIDVNDTFITGGTVTSGGTLDLFRNDNVTVSVPNVTYWISGSSGTTSIKAINNTNLDSTGDRSVAWGNQTLSSGNDSTAWGIQTSATTLGSTASGYKTIASGSYSHSEGSNTTASGSTSHAEGVQTTASGDGSHAEGYQTTASGIYSHAEGNSTTASGPASHAEGYLTTASGNYSHAEGFETTASGYYSHAEGISTTASNYYSHAEGDTTTASGYGSHAEGASTIASGNYSHAEGVLTTASGYYSHAEGYQTSATTVGSHAEGRRTTASGNGSHAEGRATTASGNYSHAQGSGTTASGNYSHAEGFQTTASGYASHAQGSGTTASGIASFASGINSIAQTDGTFIHSENSLVTGQRSVVLGGQNITGSTNDTVFVPYLNLNLLPTLNNSNTEILSRNSSNGQVEYTPLSAFTSLDTFVTGFTYNPTSNTFTISQNQGQIDLTASIDTVSGLTISNLTAGRVVYVGTGGELTDESGFEYNDTTNLLTVGDLNVTNASGTTATIGQGGLVIGSGGSTSSPGIGDLTVHGDLTVFGDTTTISTSELYVEDPQITLNYNPTGDTSTTSIASGLRIQDGDGSGNDVFYTVAQMNTFTGGDVTEYTGANGYTNRAFLTQLNDIVIRNTNSNNGAPDGVRVLGEGDVLDGGQY